MAGIIDVTTRLYLEQDVNEEEAQKIVDNMDYKFEHELIAHVVTYRHVLTGRSYEL
jgi:hypothetical protein